jgi:hypothetical protein
VTNDQRVLCFDAESNGLHGEAFAIGAVLLDVRGNELARFTARAPDPSPLDPWVREHVMPALAGMPVTHVSPRAMRTTFWDWFQARKEGALVIADCGWPVEARLLDDCVRDEPEARAWKGPYPLHDLATLLVANGLPFDTECEPIVRDVFGVTGAAHNPLWDARCSGLMATLLLRQTPDAALTMYRIHGREMERRLGL